MNEIKLSQLNIYPIKSTRALSLDEAIVEVRGLRGDRRWVLVDASGKFITQREQGKLALIAAIPDGVDWRVSAPGMPDLCLSEPVAGSDSIPVQFWSDSSPGRVAAADINRWFSDYLGSDTRAVFQHEEGSRPIREPQAGANDVVSFADGYPLLLIGEGSLADLNARLDVPVDMRRFRPNLVVSGCAPFAEDEWKKIRIGDIEFDLVKHCSRCVLTTRDPDTGELDPQRNPLRTLSTYRRREGGVMFGQNLIGRGLGVLRIGQRVEILA